MYSLYVGRAQDLLAERLAQRSNERTPGRRLSSHSYSVLSKSSPGTDSTRPYPFTETRSSNKSKGREKVGYVGCLCFSCMSNV